MITMSRRERVQQALSNIRCTVGGHVYNKTSQCLCCGSEMKVCDNCETQQPNPPPEHDMSCLCPICNRSFKAHTVGKYESCLVCGAPAK